MNRSGHDNLALTLHRRTLAALIAIVLALAAAVGCASGGAGSVVSVDEAIPPDAHRDRWQADADRLYVDIVRAMERMEWALLRIDPSTERALERRGKPTAAQPIRAEAMLPDNRTARIVGHLTADNHIEVHVKVGHFGDRELEREYIRTLKDVLDDKPKPKRGIFFELPPLITGEK